MSASTSTDHIEQFFHHLAALKAYALRVLVNGDNLSGHEEKDLAFRMSEFIEIGGSFDLSKKEMVMILYRELFKPA